MVLQDADKKKLALTELKRRHAFMKEEVQKIERDENLSLQIYAVAKSLAEALSWKDMAPRLTTGIQKIFGAQEFLLYSFDETGSWNLLHRRGSWTSEPPIRQDHFEEASFFYPPNTTEVVPVL